MDIETLRADHKAREEAIVRELNTVIAQQQQLARRKEALLEEALRLNGEGRLLNRLSENGGGSKTEG